MTMSQNSWNKIFQFEESITARTAKKKKTVISSSSSSSTPNAAARCCSTYLHTHLGSNRSHFSSFLGLREIDKKPNGIVQWIASKSTRTNERQSPETERCMNFVNTNTKRHKTLLRIVACVNCIDKSSTIKCVWHITIVVRRKQNQ